MALAARIATAASSGIVNLAWNDCGTFGTALRTFDCASNLGTHELVGSYTSYVNLDSLNGNEIVLDMQTSGSSLSWWQIRNYTDGTLGCRGGAVAGASIGFDFTSGPASCRDYWSGRALGGMGAIRNYTSNNRQRILGVCAVGLSQAGPLESGVETYSFRIIINNTKTVGTGACTGCSDGALLLLTSITCTQNPGVEAADPEPEKKMETLGTFASFQYVLPGAPGIMPTRKTTWGAVKSLYR